MLIIYDKENQFFSDILEKMLWLELLQPICLEQIQQI